EVDERGGQRPSRRAVLEPASEAQVELHDVGRELENVAEAREPRADVVDCDPRTEQAEIAQTVRESLIVGDRSVLGELDDESAGERRDEREELVGDGDVR